MKWLGLSFEDLHHWRSHLKGDVFGGITAAIVALPLALAFGVASGLGAAAGLWGAIALGFFAALFGGTPTQVSGPTGPMTVVMAGIAAQFADRPGVIFAIVMMAGLVQILLGLLRFGRFIALMPYPVISGFMSGIGVIIIILELPPLLGVDSPGGGVLGTLRSLPEILSQISPVAASLGLGTFLLLLIWPRRLTAVLPSPLVALILGTILAAFLFPGVPTIGFIPQELPTPHLPVIDWSALPVMVQSALVLAVLGMIDTLLTALVADNLTESEHRPDQELFGQGIGNFLAGVIGGIPGAGATMRTVINIQSGGRTRLSGMIHAIILLAFVLGLAPLAAHIPHAVLAGILLKVGFDIIDWHGLRQMAKAPGEGTVFMGIVFVLTVLVDLITAVGVGLFLSAILTLDRLSQFQLANIEAIVDGDSPHLNAEEQELLQRAGGRLVFYRLAGPFSFGAAKGMVRRLSRGDLYDALVLDFSEVPFLDTSAARAIEDAIQRTRRAGKTVFLIGLKERPRRLLERMGALVGLSSDAIRENRTEAIRAALGELGLSLEEAAKSRSTKSGQE